MHTSPDKLTVKSKLRSNKFIAINYSITLRLSGVHPSLCYLNYKCVMLEALIKMIVECAMMSHSDHISVDVDSELTSAIFCLACNCLNDPTHLACQRCGKPLTGEVSYIR